MITDSLAQLICAGYYELGTENPLFCDRNSKFIYSMAKVNREHSSGYGWYIYLPQEVLDKYPEWQKNRLRTKIDWNTRN